MTDTTRERHLDLIVHDWPAFGKTMTFSLSPTLLPDRDAIARWAEARFGSGRLEEAESADGDSSWSYHRTVAGPRGIWKIFTFLLNGSYA